MRKIQNHLKPFLREVLGRQPPVNRKLFFLRAVPFAILFYVGDKLAWLYQYCQGQTMFVRLFHLLANTQLAFQKPWFSFEANHMLAGLTLAGAFLFIAAYRSRNAKKYRHGMEYGSARWGTAKDIAPFIDPVYENNILLTATERLTMNSRPKQPKFARNKNVLVIGGSGSGKTRFYVKPGLMQMHPKCSYIVTDPKGTLIVECGKMLERGGYRIKALNTINFNKSMHYNPFSYIRSEKDILKLVNALIANTRGDGEKSSEDFWIKSERLLFCALIGYLWYEAPEEEQNFTMLLELINAFEVREEDETYGLNYQKTGHELMSRDELAVMDGNKCILQLRGVRPFLSDKFDITRHKRYRMLSDADPKNAFHIERYLEHRLRLSPNEVYEFYDFTGSLGEEAEESSQGDISSASDPHSDTPTKSET